MSKKLSEISNNSKLAIDKLILEQKDLDSRISSDIQAVSD